MNMHETLQLGVSLASNVTLAAFMDWERKVNQLREDLRHIKLSRLM